MAKGFILAITVVLVLVVMLIYIQNFAAKQNNDLSDIAQLLAGEKVTHTWSDVNDDIRRAANLLIEKINNSANFYDSLPAKNKVSDYLHNYGLFIQTYYKTPDTNIQFLTPTGGPMDLGDIPPVITILPQNIQYYYPAKPPFYDGWAKRELFINSSLENYSAIKDVILKLNFSNVYLDCKPANPAASKNCEGPGTKTPAKSWCNQNPASATYPLYINISLSDYLGRSYNFSERCAELDNPGAVWNVPIAHESGSSDYWVKMSFGVIPSNVMNVELHNVEVNSSTSLILNTSDFYISYLADLGVEAVDYNTSRIDRA